MGVYCPGICSATMVPETQAICMGLFSHTLILSPASDNRHTRPWPPTLSLWLSGLHLSTSEKIFRFQDTGLLLWVLGSLLLGGILAFGLGFSEFLLVSRTSSLTLSIAGIFKVHTGK